MASARFLLLVVIALSVPLGRARAQPLTLTLEGWGQTYRPAALANVEARLHAYPWIRAEAQVWTGQVPRADGIAGDVVVLAAYVREPSGHLEARAGRFVLTTGAVRPIHVDGGSVRVQSDGGTALEVFGGVPVMPRFTRRAYDWMVGTRLSQRLSHWGAIGASYVERRDRGREVDEEIGADAVFRPARHVDLSGRMSYDLVSRGLSEVQGSASLGGVERRAELFGSLRNASLLLPATSLFSVLSDAVSVQAGASGRYRVAPRLRLGGLVAYRGVGSLAGVRARLDATLWLDDDGKSAVEGSLTRDGVEGQRWSGLRALAYRDVIENVRLMAEVELVRADRARNDSRLWPWGRLSGRYAFLEHWQLSVGAEGSASPEFVRLFQALFRVAYVGAVL